MPSTILMILIFIVPLILIIGLVVMAIGGKTSKNFSTKLMAARVAVQALVIIMLVATTFVN